MRLTKKELMSVINQPMCFGSRLVGKKMFAQIIKELCEYKTNEEELGIDLITLFKALKNGIWVKIFSKLKNGGSIIHVPCMLTIVEIGGGVDKSFGLVFYVNTKRRYLVLDTRRDNDLKDYGKTWALTREELK